MSCIIRVAAPLAACSACSVDAPPELIESSRETDMRYRQHHFAALIAAMLAASGCARTAPAAAPKASIETARLALQEAQREEAPQYAPNDFQLARQKLDRAERELDARRYVNARRFGEQATVDARVAETRAQAARAQAALIENRDTSSTLERVR